MREINFRGRCAFSGEWTYGYYYPSKGNDIIRTKDDKESIVLPESVGEFTGLKDKNGKDIFEDDIIQFDFGKKSKEGIINTLVIFESGMFCYDGFKSKQIKNGSEWKQKHDYCYSLWWGRDKHPLRSGYYGQGDCKNYQRSKLIEIIGNIHEHKHLLE